MTAPKEPQTQRLELSMRDMGVVREALIRQRDGIRAAVAPFGLLSTWDAETRVTDVLGRIVEARCALKARQHPDYNPAGDSECEGYATDAQVDAWNAAHPDAPTTAVEP